MARSWSSNFVIINPSIVSTSTGGRDFGVRRLAGASKSAEARRRLTSKQYRYIDLTGILLSPSQHEELTAVADAAEGSLLPILCFDSRHCLIEDADGTPALIGTGDGTAKVFQLRRQTGIQGRAGYLETIRYPNYNYPDFLNTGGNPSDTYPELQIWCNGVPVSSLWSVDRESGLVSTTLVGDVAATGAFLTRFIMPNSYQTTLEGPLYRISDNVRLEEPYED